MTNLPLKQINDIDVRRPVAEDVRRSRFVAPREH
jgi:hypothetical protein